MKRYLFFIILILFIAGVSLIAFYTELSKKRIESHVNPPFKFYENERYGFKLMYFVKDFNFESIPNETFYLLKSRDESCRIGVNQEIGLPLETEIKEQTLRIGGENVKEKSYYDSNNKPIYFELLRNDEVFIALWYREKGQGPVKEITTECIDKFYNIISTISFLSPIVQSNLKPSLEVLSTINDQYIGNVSRGNFLIKYKIVNPPSDRFNWVVLGHVYDQKGEALMEEIFNHYLKEDKGEFLWDIASLPIHYYGKVRVGICLYQDPRIFAGMYMDSSLEKYCGFSNIFEIREKI